jgi:hypothetical protein
MFIAAIFLCFSIVAPIAYDYAATPFVISPLVD